MKPDWLAKKLKKNYKNKGWLYKIAFGEGGLIVETKENGDKFMWRLDEDRRWRIDEVSEELRRYFE